MFLGCFVFEKEKGRNDLMMMFLEGQDEMGDEDEDEDYFISFLID